MVLNRFVKIGLLSLCVGLACLGLIYKQLAHEQDIYVKQIPLKTPLTIGGDFTLTDHTGRSFSTKDYRGKFLLIYFGYMFCPDICPLGLQNMSKALDLLKRDISQVVPIFVTVDPQRDGVKDLAIYASNYHSSFKMLTGKSEEIQAVLNLYHVYAQKATPDGTSSEYLMDHSTLIYLMGRDGAFLQSFSHTTPPEELAAAITKKMTEEMAKEMKKER